MGRERIYDDDLGCDIPEYKDKIEFQQGCLRCPLPDCAHTVERRGKRKNKKGKGKKLDPSIALP